MQASGFTDLGLLLIFSLWIYKKEKKNNHETITQDFFFHGTDKLYNYSIEIIPTLISLINFGACQKRKQWDSNRRPLDFKFNP